MSVTLDPKETNERCGLVLSDGSYVELENIAEDPEKSFEMAPEAVVALLETGKVVGTWHTHPNGPPTLSGADHDTFCAWPDLSHEIVGTTGKKTYVVKNGVLLECD